MAQPEESLQSPQKINDPVSAEEKALLPELLGDISRELRSRLNAILSLAEILDEGIYGPQTEQQHQALSSLIENGEQMRALINDAAIFSRFEMGGFDLQTTPVCVLGLCQASIRLARERSYHKEIQLDLQHDNQVDVMQADEWMLKQILINLLDASLCLTTEKGSISLTVQGDLENALVLFSVESSGGALTDDDLPHLFEPFARLGHPHTGSSGETGLKLALVERMVRAQGGKVTAQNRPNQGTQFLVTLPWSRPARKGKTP